MLVLTALCLGLRATNLKKFFRPEQVSMANTGKEAEFLSPEEKETLAIINLARLYPKQFLKMYMDYAGSRAVSGNTYYTSLTKDLKEMEPGGLLLPDKDMYESAKCWATEAGTEGIVGHNRKECRENFSGECCSYGMSKAIDIVMQLLIDDGVKSLGHRRICLSNGYNRVGISLQPHKTYRVNTVLDFCWKGNGNYAKASSGKQKIKRTVASKTKTSGTMKKKALSKKPVAKNTVKKKSGTNPVAAKKKVAKKPMKQVATVKNGDKQKAPAKKQLAKN
jgi:hypothetical protein